MPNIWLLVLGGAGTTADDPALDVRTSAQFRWAISEKIPRITLAQAMGHYQTYTVEYSPLEDILSCYYVPLNSVFFVRVEWKSTPSPHNDQSMKSDWYYDPAKKIHARLHLEQFGCNPIHGNCLHAERWVYDFGMGFVSPNSSTFFRWIDSSPIPKPRVHHATKRATGGVGTTPEEPRVISRVLVPEINTVDQFHLAISKKISRIILASRSTVPQSQLESIVHQSPSTILQSLPPIPSYNPFLAPTYSLLEYHIYTVEYAQDLEIPDVKTAILEGLKKKDLASDLNNLVVEFAIDASDYIIPLDSVTQIRVERKSTPSPYNDQSMKSDWYYDPTSKIYARLHLEQFGCAPQDLPHEIQLLCDFRMGLPTAKRPTKQLLATEPEAKRATKRLRATKGETEHGSENGAGDGGGSGRGC